ncbi:MAG: hypothetical protein JWR54_3669 [Mucilaginibacter sp.]|jgi:hypothetical protein|nr:hypothetical protein [Mucilaginibacter sp.]
MHNKGTKSRQAKLFLWIAGTLFLFIVGFCVLANYNQTFQFYLFNAYSANYSSTKEEAIHRKTFVCDLETPSNPFIVSGSHVLYVHSGWIEQPWSGGFWFWTTNKDTGSNAYYNIVLIGSKNKNDTSDWTIINKPKSNSSGYMQLQDDLNRLGRLTGTIDLIPISDTLRYTVLKRDTIDFTPGNIEGVLTIVLRRKR